MIIGHQKHETTSSLNFLDEGNIDAQFEGLKFWELELEFQILDVQGRLKLSLSSWRDILGAPPPVIKWVLLIEIGITSLKVSTPVILTG